LLVIQDTSCAHDIVVVAVQMNCHVKMDVYHVGIAAATAVGVAGCVVAPVVAHDIVVLCRVENCRMHTLALPEQ
jgi:hypothetical protein